MRGYAPGSGSAPSFWAKGHTRGTAPTLFFKLTARLSLASYPAAEPRHFRRQSRVTPGGCAASYRRQRRKKNYGLAGAPVTGCVRLYSAMKSLVTSRLDAA